MSTETFDFEKTMTKTRLMDFAEILKQMSRKIGFKVSARGWCYQLEQARYIDKNQFDKVESAVNKCRKRGMLPVDFIAEEDSRSFSGIETPSDYSMPTLLKSMLRDVLEGNKYFTPDWWEGEENYIQVVVEKVDLKTLFKDVCEDFHIPIANAKGWSSILQRAEYARRFKEAERRGLNCILLYCGDHDPDGLRISETLRKNLQDVSDVYWIDGFRGYDTTNLQIERFGLNYDFITENNYTWIDNLITGSGGNLADPNHRNFHLDYVQDYLQDIGERKCEANAIVTTPTEARDLIRDTIENYLGGDAVERFEAKTEAIEKKYQKLLEKFGLYDTVKTAVDSIEDEPDDDDDNDDGPYDDDDEEY